MTPNEVIDLLSIIAGYDRRTVGHADVEAWRLALDDPRIPNLAYDECVDAVILHYRDTSEFVMPSHILNRVRAHRAGALARIQPARTTDRTAYEHVNSLWRDAHRDAKTRMAAARAAVLAYPDLAERLTEPPLGFARAEQWRGNVGPEVWSGEHNDSARREALADLVAEATRRSKETASA